MVGERRTGRHIQANLTSPGRRILVHCTWAGLAPDASVTVNTPGERGTSDDCRISLILADERFLASRARVSLVAGEAGVDRGTWISVVSVPFAAPARAG
jgi:hypothetical protein